MTSPMGSLDLLFTPRLRYFMQCVEHPSFTEAASRIGLTQAALSQAVKQLENELGVVLFERRARGCELTPAGRQLFAIAKQHQQRMAVDWSDALDPGSRPIIRVGAVMHFGVYHLRPLLESLRPSLPRLQLSMTWSLDSMTAVKDGKIDFAFVAWTTRPKGVQFTAIRSDPSAIVGLRSKYRQIENARSVTELAKLPWIAQPKPQADWTRALPVDRDGYTVRDMFAFRELILSGVGIADAQLGFFTDRELKRLVIARHLPSRYQNEAIYAIHRDDIRGDARRCLDQLVKGLSPAAAPARTLRARLSRGRPPEP